MVGQRGSGALVMVILILMMGTALLHATRRQLQDSLALVSDEQRYIEQFIRASSALAWGGQQTWPDVEAWFCQRDNVYSWRACILNHSSGVLLRGDSGEGTLSLYRWVRRLPAGTVSAIPHGWLDYCPLAERSRCDVSAR